MHRPFESKLRHIARKMAYDQREFDHALHQRGLMAKYMSNGVRLSADPHWAKDEAVDLRKHGHNLG